MIKKLIFINIIFLVMIAGINANIVDENTECIEANARFECIYKSEPRFFNDEGIFKTIETGIEILDNDHEYYQYGYRGGVTKGAYGAFFKNNYNQTWPVAIQFKNTALQYKVTEFGYLDPSKDNTYQKLGEVLDSSQPTLVDNIITYPDIVLGVDLKYIYNNKGLKEEIYCKQDCYNYLSNNLPSTYGLSDANSYLVWKTDLNIVDVNLYIENNPVTQITSSNKRLLMKNAQGLVEYMFPTGIAYDSHRTDSTIILRRIVPNGGNPYLMSGIKLVDMAGWTRPIIFDPTVELSNDNTTINISVESGYYKDMFVENLQIKLNSIDEIELNTTLIEVEEELVKHELTFTNPTETNNTYNISIINQVNWNNFRWGQNNFNVNNYNQSNPYIIDNIGENQTELMYLLRMDDVKAKYSWKDMQYIIDEVLVYKNDEKSYIEIVLNFELINGSSIYIDPIYVGSSCAEIQTNLNNGYDIELNDSVTCEIDVTNSSSSYFDGKGYTVTGGFKISISDFEIKNTNITSGYTISYGGLPGNYEYGVWSNETSDNISIENSNIYTLQAGNGQNAIHLVQNCGDGGKAYGISLYGDNHNIYNVTIKKVDGGNGGSAAASAPPVCIGGAAYGINFLDNHGNETKINLVTIDWIDGGDAGSADNNNDGASGGGGYSIYASNSNFITVNNTFINYTHGGTGSQSTEGDENAGAGGNAYAIYFGTGTNNTIVNNNIQNTIGGSPGNDQCDSFSGKPRGIYTGAGAYVDNNIVNEVTSTGGGNTIYGTEAYGIYVETNSTVSNNNITGVHGRNDDNCGAYLNGGQGTGAGIYLNSESTTTYVNNQFPDGNVTAGGGTYAYAIYPKNFTSLQPETPQNGADLVVWDIIFYRSTAMVSNFSFEFGDQSDPTQFSVGTGTVGTNCNGIFCFYNWTINDIFTYTYFFAETTSGAYYNSTSTSYLLTIDPDFTFEEVSLLPTTAYTNDNLVAWCDANGNTADTYHYKIYKNDTLVIEGSTPAYDGLRVNVTTISSENTTKNDVWISSCMVQIDLETGIWENSSTVNILGSTPTFEQSNFTYNISHNSNLSLQLNASDADNDSFTWSINNTDHFTINQSGVINRSAQNEVGVFNVEVNATDTDGTTTMFILFNITNNAPVVDVSILPLGADEDDNLTCTNITTDSDGDPITDYSLIWYVDDVYISAWDNTTFIPAVNTSLNDQWVCSIAASDFEGFSTYYNSSAMVIGDTVPPVLSDDSLSSSSGQNDAPFTIYVNATEQYDISYTRVEITDPNSIKSNFSMTLFSVSGTERKYSRTYIPSTDGVYTFKFFSQDGTGNVGTLDSLLTYTESTSGNGDGAPGGGGGGGGDSKDFCDIMFTPESVRITGTGTKTLEIFNDDEVVFTPNVIFSDNINFLKFTLPTTNILSQQYGELNIINERQINEKIEGTLTLSSSECKDIEISIELTPTILGVSFFDKELFDIGGLTITNWWIAALGTMVGVTVSFIGAKPGQRKLGTRLAIVIGMITIILLLFNVFF